jgi:hypothetical protein
MIRVKINKKLNESLLLEAPYIALDDNDQEVLNKFYDLLEVEMTPKYRKAFEEIKDSNAFDLATEAFKLLKVYNNNMPRNIRKFYIDLKDTDGSTITFLIDDSERTTINIVDDKEDGVDTLPDKWYLAHVLRQNKNLIVVDDVNDPKILDKK